MKRVIQHPYAILLVYITLAAWMAGYAPPHITVDVGGDQQSGLREYDTPYITGFWPSEPQPWTPSLGPALRWTNTEWRIHWPHAGIGWWTTSIRIDTSGRSSAPAANVTWQSPPMGNSRLDATARLYHILVQSTESDTPFVASSVNTFQPANDTRQLGIAITQIRLTPIYRYLPGLGFLWLCICLWWGWWFQTRMSIAAVSIAALSLGVYYFFPEWVMVHTSIGMPLTLAGMLACRLLWRQSATRKQTSHIIIMTSLLQLILLTSPWLRSSDIAMHIRMLKQVITGSLLFTAQLPCEAGAYISPYPPMVYVLMAPIAMLLPSADTLRLLLLTIAVIVNGLAVWYMGNVMFASQHTSRHHAWFVVLASMNFPLLRAAHTGEISNAVAHGIVTIAIMSWFDQRATTTVRVLLATVALLAHTGNSISFVLMTGILVLLNVYEKRQIAVKPLLPYVIIPLCFTLLYYSNYTALIGQAPGYAGCPPEITLSQRIMSLGNVIPVVFVMSASIGMAMLRQHTHRAACVMGTGAALISASMLLINTQTVRWGISVIPFLALPTALLFTRMWRIGMAGKVLALVSTTAWIWVLYAQAWVRVLTYLHD